MGRCQGQKVINHVVFTHKWFYAFMTRPKMRIKVVHMHHDIRIRGRIVGVQSTKQFVRHLLTLISFHFPYNFSQFQYHGGRNGQFIYTHVHKGLCQLRICSQLAADSRPFSRFVRILYDHLDHL